MYESSIPEPRPVPHIESKTFIKKLKLRIKKKVRMRQYLTRKSYTDCLEEICELAGFDSRHSYSTVLKALEQQSKSLCIDEDRMRCLSEEKLIPNASYFLVRGKLGLEVHLNNDSESCMAVHGVRTDNRFWPDELRIHDDSQRAAKPVDCPPESLAKLRLAGEKQIHIINYETDLESWLDGWSGIAFLEENLVRKNIKLAIWLSLEVPTRPTFIL